MPHRPLVAIATDGVRWQGFRPTLADPDKPTPAVGDVFLGEPVRRLEVRAGGKGDPLGDFYFWLQHLLFRPQQTVPTADLFAFDFGTDGVLYAEAHRRLSAAWAQASANPLAHTAFDALRRYLRYTYALAGGEAGLADLFLRHTYLASVARLLAWASLSEGKAGGRDMTGHEAATAILSGRWFRERGLPNVVDEDFFGWVYRDGAAVVELSPLWEQTLATLRGYDLSRIGQDVLKDVYEQLVNPEERHGLGEYYTPDRLCERVVAEVLPTDRAAPVLDPSCGSGGFLRACIDHYRRHVRFDGPADAAAAIVAAVAGIDVHPLAVTVARVTYLLALRDLLPDVHGDLQIPVYLADALFLPTEVTQSNLFDGVTEGYEIRFGPRGPESAPATDAQTAKAKPAGGRKAAARGRDPGGSRVVAVPKALVEAPQWFDPAVAAAAAAPIVLDGF